MPFVNMYQTHTHTHTHTHIKSQHVNKILKEYFWKQINYNYFIIMTKKYKNYHHNFFHSVFNIINRLIKY